MDTAWKQGISLEQFQKALGITRGLNGITQFQGGDYTRSWTYWHRRTVETHREIVKGSGGQLRLPRSQSECSVETEIGSEYWFSFTNRWGCTYAFLSPFSERGKKENYGYVVGFADSVANTGYQGVKGTVWLVETTQYANPLQATGIIPRVNVTDTWREDWEPFKETVSQEGIGAYDASRKINGVTTGTVALVIPSTWISKFRYLRWFSKAEKVSDVKAAYPTKAMESMYKTDELWKASEECVTYLDDVGRAAHRITIKNGKCYDSAGSLINSIDSSSI